MNLILASLMLALLPVCAIAQSAPAPINEYPIHVDGGLIYDPLRREAEQTGQLARYRNVETQTGEVKLGQYKLRFEVPKQAKAYDVVPIKYHLSWKGKAGFPLAVEATAFEDEAKRKGRDLYDLALPGKLDLKVDYLGSITANLRPNGRHIMKPDLSDTPAKYPPFERKPMVKSGVVEAGDLIWFKFKFKNLGNTILDPEGFGGCQISPEICRKDAKGEYQVIGKPHNLYYRDLEYLYPGEAHETWVQFTTSAKETPQGYGLIPGEYLIRVKMTYRWYKDYYDFINIWDGPPMFAFEMPITVEKSARQAPVAQGKVTLTDANDPDKITRWLHTFEEFMTAFDCHQAPPKNGSNFIDGTLHLQVAPWTKQVVLKLISTGPVSIATSAVPLNVDSNSLSVKLNPNNSMCVVKNGQRKPVIYSQTMADMRSNIQIGPFPEKHIRERMREMMDCGINIVATTSMPWLYDIYNNPNSNNEQDAWKYFLDLARDEGMLVEGWGSYPYDRSSVFGIANWINQENKPFNQFLTAGYYAASHVDPDLPRATTDMWLYQFHRWGDLFYQLERGDVPIGVEDSRGWMRQDINIRNPMGDSMIKAFQDWSKQKYGTIEAANTAWGSQYKSFDEVNPEADQMLNPFGHKWEYFNLKHPFHDWSPAIADLDQFRTELRVKNYQDTIALVRKEIPGATVMIRTEGANVLVKGINPADRNPHFRHIYYSQRRCGMIADIVQKSGTVKLHSDYTTLPYTPSELRKLVTMSVEQGIIPVYLAQFDNMRDIAINSKYGTDFTIHYNLSEPKKGTMMHCLTAVYPWFKAMYESGGVPGILWEDYLCDGFATETQKREMRLFKDKLNEALSTPEGKKWQSENVKEPPKDWRKGSKAKRSYVH